MMTTAKMSREEKAELAEEVAEARVWLEGLDQINNCRKGGKPAIGLCVDLSATPFYLRGSGYPEGQPFPWIVSDFGLVDGEPVNGTRSSTVCSARLPSIGAADLWSVTRSLSS